MIHDRKDLQEVQKFAHFKELLMGDPLRLISGMELGELQGNMVNYIKAVKIIRERYGNKNLSLLHTWRK